MRTMQTLLMVTATGGFLSASVSAAVIAEHIGSVDPKTEAVSSTNATKWTKTGTDGYGSAQMGPPPAWRIDDVGSGTLYYAYTPSVEEHAAAEADGWSFSFSLRINTPDVGNKSTIYQQYATGSKAYTLLIGTDANSNPLISLNGSADVIVTDGDDDDNNNQKYHVYELRYTPGSTPYTGTANLLVDGNVVLTGVAWGSTSSNRVAWGAGFSAGKASLDYAWVRFETVPEPSSLVLLGVGGLLLMRRRT